MKKLLTIIIASISLFSCAANNQETLNLNLSIAQKYSDVGGNKSVELNVVDARKDKDLLGRKRLGENLVVIKSGENFVDLVHNKITRDLEQNGFLVAAQNTGLADKFLEVKILTFNYNAYREFVVGSSKIEVLIKITARNKVGSANYSTTQSFSLDKNHFIMPLISTDEKTINTALQEALDGVFSNQKLLEFLKN
ncbi:MAG: YajG family lipoprotein [Pseudomonadota bacterium]